MTQTITANRADLLPALGLVVKAVERRNTIPILQNVLLAAERDRLTVTGSDLDIEIAAALPCRVEEPIAFTLPAGLLHDAVRKLPDGAEIGIAVEKDFATVSSGRSRFKLQLPPASDFPTMQSGDFGHSFVLPAPQLTKMLATVAFAVSSEEARYYLNGIHWHQEGEQLAAVATDGHRLAKLSLPLPEGAAGLPGIILPRKTVNLLRGLSSDKGEIAVSLSDAKILFSIDNGEGKTVSMLSKLIDGTFPDYRRVVPSGNGNRFQVARSSLHAAIDRVTTIASERGSAVKFSFGSDGQLKLAAANPDAGSAEDFVSVEANGDAVEIGFNGRYCLDMLAASPGEKLVFELADNATPALIRPEGDPGTLFVIMPMRVS